MECEQWKSFVVRQEKIFGLEGYKVGVLSWVKECRRAGSFEDG